MKIKYKLFYFLFFLILCTSQVLADNEKPQVFTGMNIGIDKNTIYGINFGIGLERDRNIGRLKFTRIGILDEVGILDSIDCLFFGFIFSRKKCVHSAYSIGEFSLLYGKHMIENNTYILIGPSYSIDNGKVGDNHNFESAAGVSFSYSKYFSKSKSDCVKFSLNLSGTLNRERSFILLGFNFILST